MEGQPEHSKAFLHPFSDELADVLREWREAKPLSRYKVWQASKVSRTWIGNIEDKKCSFTMEIGVRICEVIGRDFADAVVEAMRRYRRKHGDEKRPR